MLAIACGIQGRRLLFLFNDEGSAKSTKFIIIDDLFFPEIMIDHK